MFWSIHNVIIKIIANIFILHNIKYYNNTFKLIKNALYKKYYSSLLVEALIIAEDRRFLLHSGIDIIAIIRAIFLYITQKKISGASTIEQQFVRTITNNKNVSVLRKIREQTLSIKLASCCDKKLIANSYLHRAYFGYRMEGVEKACNTLGYDINNLNIDQACYLIAMLKYPMPKMRNTDKLSKLENRKNFIKKCLIQVHQDGLKH